jgi:hypothetical protein
MARLALATIAEFGADACNLLILEDNARVFRHPGLAI